MPTETVIAEVTERLHAVSVDMVREAEEVVRGVLHPAILEIEDLDYLVRDLTRSCEHEDCIYKCAACTMNEVEVFHIQAFRLATNYVLDTCRIYSIVFHPPEAALDPVVHAVLRQRCTHTEDRRTPLPPVCIHCYNEIWGQFSSLHFEVPSGKPVTTEEVTAGPTRTWHERLVEDEA